MPAEPDCDLSALDADEVTADADLDAVVLFADIDPADAAAVAERVAMYEEFFGRA